jgi:hypothetical protein
MQDNFPKIPVLGISYGVFSDFRPGFSGKAIPLYNSEGDLTSFAL